MSKERERLQAALVGKGNEDSPDKMTLVSVFASDVVEVCRDLPSSETRDALLAGSEGKSKGKRVAVMASALREILGE